MSLLHVDDRLSNGSRTPGQRTPKPADESKAQGHLRKADALIKQRQYAEVCAGECTPASLVISILCGLQSQNTVLKRLDE